MKIYEDVEIENKPRIIFHREGSEPSIRIELEELSLCIGILADHAGTENVIELLDDLSEYF